MYIYKTKRFNKKTQLKNSEIMYFRRNHMMRLKIILIFRSKVKKRKGQQIQQQM